MTAYETALFIHLLGVVTLFAAIALVQTAGVRLRRAARVEDVRLWITVIRSAAPLFPIAVLAVLGGGLFMAADGWTFTTPWVMVALVGVVLGGVAIGAVQGSRFAAIGKTAAAAENGPVPTHLRELIAAPVLWVSVFAPDAGTVGILWTMASKPGWAGAIVAVVGLAIVGATAGYIVTTRRTERAATSVGG